MPHTKSKNRVQVNSPHEHVKQCKQSAIAKTRFNDFTPLYHLGEFICLKTDELDDELISSMMAFFSSMESEERLAISKDDQSLTSL
ncbi:hypothetical protein N7490_010638 [Penicillium lividum]|nr:hypothetical protein N7490_010638 [Penicillium lividum]